MARKLLDDNRIKEKSRSKFYQNSNFYLKKLFFNAFRANDSPQRESKSKVWVTYDCLMSSGAQN